MYDYIFKNAEVIDGSGGPAYKADVAVFSSLISLIAPVGSIKAKHVIDAEGLTLAPGFIDIHSHSDIEVLKKSEMKDKVMQGITSEVNGNCGVGLFPLPDNKKDFLEITEDILGIYNGEWDWKDYKGYKEKLKKKGMGLNMGFLTAHSALRLSVLKDDVKRSAKKEEIDAMCSLLDASLSSGSLGFSTGLYYSPCLFADKAELIALLKVVKKHEKIFAVHHRCEGDDLLDSLKEVLDLSLSVGVKLEISHLKAIGVRNQWKVEKALSLIESYRDKGLDVCFDQYPYEYGSTGLFSLLPPDIQSLTRIEQRLAISLENEREEIKKEMLEPTGWDSIYSLVGPDNIRILYLDSSPDYEGLTIEEIAKKRGSDPLDTLLDLLAEETGRAVMMDVTESEENLMKILKHPLMGFGTDSLFSSPFPHPRSKEATMHLIKEYVNNKKVLSVEEAVRKMSAQNAERLGLKERGYIKEGMKADLVLFDKKKAEIKTVLVNGQAAVLNGVFQNTLSGGILE